jgi:hypothetical protein
MSGGRIMRNTDPNRYALILGTTASGTMFYNADFFCWGPNLGSLFKPAFLPFEIINAPFFLLGKGSIPIPFPSARMPLFQ